jgi:hypothetical protein
MGGHSGVNKTQNAISKRYYWPSITADIKSWVNIMITTYYVDLVMDWVTATMTTHYTVMKLFKKFITGLGTNKNFPLIIQQNMV